MSFFQRSAPILALGLCFVLIPASQAAPKKTKKNVDLSANPLADVNSKQPDKELYDKAMVALKKGRYDIARLDLQTLMNTYPDSEYQMRSKLAVGDTWYKEGGTAAMAQAEQEYKDFKTFFPNVPEAAEAQMKVGDIYFAQMDKPDRDPQNAQHAEDEYREMVQQFPDSQLVPRAKQRLREVQEVLAARQFEIGEFYATRENWAASIARLQTVADNYPLFSHSDQTLISIGDAYAQQASMVGTLNIPPTAKAELQKAYNDRAAQAWDRVVTRYPMAAHVEDAKDRLIAAGRPVPEPSAAEMAESEAEEGSRAPVRLKDRALLLIQHGPSTVESVRVGEPSMVDASPTLAPAVAQKTQDNFNLAMKGTPIPAPEPLGVIRTATAANGSGAPTATDAGAVQGAITMENVPDNSGGGSNRIGAEVVSAPNAASAAAGPSDAVPSSTDAPPVNNTAAPDASGTPVSNTNLVSTPASGSTVGAPTNNAPAATTPPANNPDRVYGLAAPVGGSTAPAPLPPVDKPAAAPDQINDVKTNGQPQVSTGTSTGKPGKKNPKPAYSGSDESSSKHHKKKGVDKLNPF